MHHYVSKYIELSQQDVPEISETFWRALRAHQKMEFQISILWLSAGRRPANSRPTKIHKRGFRCIRKPSYVMLHIRADSKCHCWSILGGKVFRKAFHNPTESKTYEILPIRRPAYEITKNDFNALRSHDTSYAAYWLMINESIDWIYGQLLKKFLSQSYIKQHIPVDG